MTCMTDKRNRNPGRPATWGPRKATSLRIPDHLLAVLEKRAEETGMSLTAYVVTALAEAHDVDLAPDPHTKEIAA